MAVYLESHSASATANHPHDKVAHLSARVVRSHYTMAALKNTWLINSGTSDKTPSLTVTDFSAGGGQVSGSCAKVIWRALEERAEDERLGEKRLYFFLSPFLRGHVLQKHHLVTAVLMSWSGKQNDE